MVSVSLSGQPESAPSDAVPAPCRLIASTGDPHDPAVMSGLPYHFLLYGTQTGVVHGAATRSLSPRSVAAGRWTWNAMQVGSLRGVGGHQYTIRRNDRLWLPPPDGATIINIFQLYPRRLLDADIRRCFFIDQTLNQLFFGYRQVDRLARGVVQRTLQWERTCYQAAEVLIANSTWAATSLVEDYAVDPERVAVVPQAANVLPDIYEQWIRARRPNDDQDLSRPLRLLFLGGDWYRKGLDRLLAAMRLVNSGGQQRLTLDVVGCAPRGLPGGLSDTPHVTWHGHVDKMTEQTRFLDLLGAADVGCLLSRAEAGGNALREYHATGLAVLGPDVGGAPEQTLPEASWLVNIDESAADIADRLTYLVEHREEVERRKAISWQRRNEVLWPNTLQAVREVLELHGV